MIRILQKHIADKIAAGEVIDRPVSIIKELVENSIDAGAGAVTVEIRNGGSSYIRVTDDGCGIAPEDVETAFLRHATSKIAEEKDLDSIGTLGFRGEALASIAAVSRVELITKRAEDKMGRRVIIEGSKVLENSGTGCPDGTTITVRDLFYNVPARRKFLGTDSAEARRITDLLSRIALSYSDIRITFINGGKRVFSTRGNGNILTNIVSIYGSDTAKDLVPIEASRGGSILKGFISSPGNTVPSRNREIFCVNGRIVSSKVITDALESGYQERLFGGRFPVAFLFLYVPPEKLDVNIHPTKKEIRFDDDFEIADLIRETVRKALATEKAVPEIRAGAIAPAHGASGVEKNLQDGEHPQLREERAAYEPGHAPGKGHANDPGSKNTIRRENASRGPLHRDNSNQVDINSILETMRIQRDSVAEMEEEVRRMTAEEGKTAGPFDFNALEVIGSVFDTYILATDGGSFYMIDQHAAHERVFYERFLAQYESEEKYSQQMLVPLSIGASAAAVSTEDEWLPILKNAGYDAEFFGGNTYLIREVPAFMTMEEAESFARDVIDEMASKPDLKNRMVVDRIIMKSCKSAVKGGDHLEPEEISSLMDQLKNCGNPFSCPHGRPTFVRMTRYEIEKMFKRV